jgi:hypothetical protein
MGSCTSRVRVYLVLPLEPVQSSLVPKVHEFLFEPSGVHFVESSQGCERSVGLELGGLPFLGSPDMVGGESPGSAAPPYSLERLRRFFKLLVESVAHQSGGLEVTWDLDGRSVVAVAHTVRVSQNGSAV